MSTRQHVSGQIFLANVRQSGLLTDAQLAEVEAKLPETNRGRVVARALVELGLLTKFQAEHILIGRTSGFQVGQYRILDQLGRGGMGRVFKAQHRTMNRIVALKVLAPTVMQSQRARELFLREVRAAAQLNHPNIVAAYDASEEDRRYYLVLEYVDGPNLEQLVGDHGPLPVSQACDYIRQAALGLQCAHERGMVHRDIKPANILVNRGGLDGKSADVVKISDFGLARLQAPDLNLSDVPVGTIMTKDNTVMGTPDYLSPEQARNLHKTDIRSDLYSLGCTFYFLLTGQVPFPGGKVMDKLIRHGTERPRPIKELRPVVPPEVVAIVNRLMAKHPKERYQTPAELVEELGALAVSGSTPWAPVGPAKSRGSLAESGETKGCGSDPDVVAVTPSRQSAAMVQTVSNDLTPTTPDAPPRPAAVLLAKAHDLGPWLAVAASLGFLGGLAIISVLLLVLTLLQR
jgi:eukaryotic-like serine/threonine-protein kinase